LTRSPLRRSTHRVEAAVTAAAAVLALLTVLVVTIVAMSAYQRAQTQAAAQAAQQTSVTAVLLTNAAVPLADSPERGVELKRPPWRVGNYPPGSNAPRLCG
jgi:hypothetical protein